MNTSRRAFLTGLLASAAAPALPRPGMSGVFKFSALPSVQMWSVPATGGIMYSDQVCEIRSLISYRIDDGESVEVGEGYFTDGNVLTRTKVQT